MQITTTPHYNVLKIIYQIVKDDLYPLKYQVHPRQLILRCLLEWNAIQSALEILETEGMIETRRLDTLHVSLTEQGFNFCRSSIHE